MQPNPLQHPKNWKLKGGTIFQNNSNPLAYAHRYARRSLKKEVTMRHSNLFAIIGLVAFFAAGCGDTIIVHEQSGLQCEADSQCPYGMVCHNETKTCQNKPPVPDPFYAHIMAPYDLVKHQSAIVMLWTNQDATYILYNYETGDVKEGTHGGNTTRPVRLDQLQPATSYLIQLVATNRDGTETYENWTTFTTKPAPAGNPLGPIAQITNASGKVTSYDGNVAEITIEYTLSALARPTLGLKYDINQPSWSTIWVGTKVTGSNSVIFSIGRPGNIPIGTSWSAWFFLRAHDDNDNPTDSEVVLVNVGF